MLKEKKSNNFLTYYNFVIFEPSSFRIEESDILCRGKEILDIHGQVLDKLAQKNSIKDNIIFNRIKKIDMMLDLVKDFDNIILTKFLNKIWRRYLYFSNLGENFLDINTFLETFPKYKQPQAQPLIFAQRILSKEDDEEETTDDNEEKTETETDSKKEVLDKVV
jgi:hypothetical protein